MKDIRFCLTMQENLEPSLLYSLQTLLSFYYCDHCHNIQLKVMSGSDRQLASEVIPRNRQRFTTSKVIRNVNVSSGTIYCLPCYVRVLVKEIENIKVAETQATISGTLIFSFYYGNVNRDIISQFVGRQNQKPAILLEFNKEESILLREGKGITVKEYQSQKIIEFIVRQRFKTKLTGHVFLTPFQTLDLYLLVTVQSVHFKLNNQKIAIKFNCMNSYQRNFNIIRHGYEVSFGNYRIISFGMQSKFTNSRKYPFKPIPYFSECCQTSCCYEKFFIEDGQEEVYEDDQVGDHDEETIQLAEASRNQNLERQQQQIDVCFQHAHFRIPIYKFPGISIITIFIPIQALGAVGLLQFFQEPHLSSRIATIAVLILAFVAFLPTINESIPQSSSIKMVDIIIMIHLAALFLLGAESYHIRNQDNNFHFIWQGNYYFLIAMCLNIGTFLTIFVLFLVHKCIWERKLRKIKKGIHLKNPKVNRNHWRNQLCDEQFTPLYRNGRVVNN